MMLLAVEEIGYYISENLNEEIGMEDCAVKVLVKDDDGDKDKEGIISELKIEELPIEGRYKYTELMK